MLFMLVTLAVFQPLRLSEARSEQSLNMLPMLVQLSVLTLLRSMLVQFVKFMNSIEQLPVKRTSLVAVTLVTAEACTSVPHL